MPKDNIGENLGDFGLGDNFLGTALKAWKKQLIS